MDSDQEKDKTYMWPQQGNETPMVGRKVLLVTGGFIMWGHDWVLMQRLYSNACEWVLESELSEYIGGSGT